MKALHDAMEQQVKALEAKSKEIRNNAERNESLNISVKASDSQRDNNVAT